MTKLLALKMIHQKLLNQIKHHRDLPSEKDDSMEDEDYDYMTTVPLMEGVKDRSML